MRAEPAIRGLVRQQLAEFAGEMCEGIARAINTIRAEVEAEFEKRLEALRLEFREAGIYRSVDRLEASVESIRRVDERLARLDQQLGVLEADRAIKH